jgi:two-component system NtrC family response regulator/two-component system response regulator HydG
LNVVAIHLPPLRDRIDDIPALAEYFFRKSCSTHKRDLKRIHPDAMYTLMNSRWPGNVRELQHAIERSVVLCTGIELIPSDLEIGTSGRDSGSTATGTLDDIERQYVQSTLHAMGGNRTKTAERLGVSLRWLQYKLKEWDLV